MDPQKQGEIREPGPVGPGRPPVEHRFKPGVSGNPGGRPRGQSITARLRALLDAETVNGGTYADEIAQALILAAGCGNLKAIREILDRTEGRPRPVELEDNKLDARSAWDDVCDEFEIDSESDTESPGALPG